MNKYVYQSLVVFVMCSFCPKLLLAQENAPASTTLKADPGNDYFARANQLYKTAVTAKNEALRELYYQRSIPLLTDYLRLYPKHKNAEAAYYYLAESYFHTGKVRESLMIYARLVKIFKTGPYVAASAYRIARNYFSQKDYMNAAKHFGITAQLTNDKIDKSKASYFQAESYMMAGKPELAAPLYGKVAEASDINPYKGKAALSFGKLSLKAADYKASLTSFEKLITPNQEPDVKAEAAYLAGIAANGLERNELSEKYFKMAMLSTSEKWKGEAQTGLMSLCYEAKDYEGVIELLQRGKFEMPPNFKAKQGFLLGQSRFKLQQYAAAIHHFIDVEIHDKGSQHAFMSGYYKLLSFYNLKNDKIPEKVDRFLQGYAVNNGRHRFIHQALLMKAETLFAKQEYKEAAQVYTSIGSDLIEEKYLPELLFRKGYSLWKVGNLVGAANSLTFFIDKYPSHKKISEVLILRAGAYAKIDSKAKALRDYDRVIKDSKEEKFIAIALQKSGIIQFHEKKYDDMIDRYKTLAKNHSSLGDKVLANVNYWICRAYFKQRKYRPGLQYLEASWKLDQETFKKQIAMLRVIGNFSLKEHEETAKAIELAEKAALEDKIPLDVYRWLGEFSYNNNDYKKAATLLEKGVEKGLASATPAVIWRYLSKAQLKIDQNEKAFISVSNLLSIEEEPSRVVDALLDKAKIQMKLGKDGDAMRTAESALEMNPVGAFQAELLKVIGDFYYNTGESEKAANHYVLLLESGKRLPEFPQILHRLARSLTKSGNATEAKRYADQLKEDYPNYKREE